MNSVFLLAFALGWLAAAPTGPPQAASAAAIPADKAAGVPVNVALSWAPGAKTRYDV